MGDWERFDGGDSIGQEGSDGGAILRDEEHTDGARITLEQGGFAPFSITCGVYGWMMHTRFFSVEGEAEGEFEKMKVALARILAVIPSTAEADDAKMTASAAAVSDFVERFP